MSSTRLNILLAIVLALTAGLTWGLQRQPEQPNVLFIPEMHYAVPYEPQSENPNFPDGKTLRTPVEGTIPRGTMPLHYTATEADARRAGAELSNPFVRDSIDHLERGTAKYVTFCQPCHGPLGNGDGIITRYGYPPPPSFASPAVEAMKDGQMFHAVTYGKGNMPSLASQIPREDRWRIILRVRALQEMARKQAVASK